MIDKRAISKGDRIVVSYASSTEWNIGQGEVVPKGRNLGISYRDPMLVMNECYLDRSWKPSILSVYHLSYRDVVTKVHGEWLSRIELAQIAKDLFYDRVKSGENGPIANMT